MTKGICLLLALVPCIALAQQAPVRDAAARPNTGTARITGSVLMDDTARTPVRRAVITISAAMMQPRMTVTDDRGQFVVSGLPAGLFTIVSQKPGYVTAYYGAKRPGRGPGVPVVVADGAQQQVALTMMKGASISGAVVDSRGRPAAGAGLQLLQYRTANGEQTLYGAYGGYGYASTDDRGFYRAWGLPPGEYLVAVTARSFGNAGLREVTAADVQWAERQFASTAPAGAPAPSAPPPDTDRVTGAPVYFPGTTDVTQAALIKIAAGEERTGVDFPVDYVRTSRLGGTVVDPSGQPVQTAQVSLVATSLQPGDFVMAMSSAGRGVVSNGRFTMNGVAPGRYSIVTRVAPTPNAATTLWGLHDVVVDGRDQMDIAIRLEPGLTLAGRVVFEGAAARPELSRLQVSMATVQSSTGLNVMMPAAAVAADGSFTVAGLIPGRYRLSASLASSPGTAQPWVVKSAVAGGRDVIDLPIEIAAGRDVTGAVVTFIDRAAELSGTVLDQAGKPTPEYSIVVFPVDRAMWLANARRIRAIRLSNTGTFQLANLPAGEYYLAAAVDYEPADLNDHAFLDQLAAAALRVTLAEGEKKQQELRTR